MSSTLNATRCMPISLGRVGSVSIAAGWMYSKSSRRPLPSGVWSMAMLAWLPSRPTAVSVHSPLTVSRPTTVSPRAAEKGSGAAGVGAAAAEAGGGVGPPSTHRVTTDDGKPEVREEGDRRFEVADGDPDVLKFDGHRWHATESARRAQARRQP